MSEQNIDKDTVLYKKIIRSQTGTQTEICDVINFLYKDSILCKVFNNKLHWYIKSTNNTFILTHEAEIRKLVFSKLIHMYHQTAECLYNNAFCDGHLIKYHYIDIANKLVHVSKDLHKHSVRNAIMRELSYVMFYNDK